jgi:hypothetical protein
MSFEANICDPFDSTIKKLKAMKFHTQKHTPINIYFLSAYQHTQLVVVPRALRFQFPVIYDIP